MEPKQKKKAHRDTGCVWVGQLLLGMGLPLNEVEMPGSLQWKRNRHSHSQQVSITSNFSVRTAFCVFLPFSMLGFAWFEFVHSCVGCHSV